MNAIAAPAMQVPIAMPATAPLFTPLLLELPLVACTIDGGSVISATLDNVFVVEATIVTALVSAPVLVVDDTSSYETEKLVTMSVVPVCETPAVTDAAWVGICVVSQPGACGLNWQLEPDACGFLRNQFPIFTHNVSRTRDNQRQVKREKGREEAVWEELRLPYVNHVRSDAHAQPQQVV